MQFIGILKFSRELEIIWTMEIRLYVTSIWQGS